MVRYLTTNETGHATFYAVINILQGASLLENLFLYLWIPSQEKRPFHEQWNGPESVKKPF